MPDQKPEPKNAIPNFPFMGLQVVPGGILLIIIRSAFDKQEILIPESNADVIAMEWLASRPADVRSQAVKKMAKIEVARSLKAVH